MSKRPVTAARHTAIAALAAAVLTAGAATATKTTAGAAANSAAPDLVALVNPFIGTARHGNVFPGADTPFGMLQWSPDTVRRPNGGGYSIRSSEITGFSLVHMSGPGCGFGGDVPVLPTVGALRPAANDYYRRSQQDAQAGYYSVRLGEVSTSGSLPPPGPGWRNSASRPIAAAIWSSS